ncbi:hypothetical protein [Streptomyces sp. ODS05-4]|uniref:hypothetical protein n=1 Tax=Streptomyces sp. ODS05-4 TaxID=2944939 RepID=UPI00210B1643|nr:hypothetical protein [Streptomyces sp. ODS05-4]
MTWARWDETEYLAYLAAERRGYAWVMRHHGGRSAVEAGSDAVDFYPYEPAHAPFRGLVFHDEAWHWAMSAVHGDRYAEEHPGLAEPSPEYRAVVRHAGARP